ncbi:MAG TPA: trypsin-like peptidase domain-containing protein [Candidatus Limnocylindrales bacterium]|nr:trypsin-like peptidase domain-containing protein [Candidatus Limnocylindrales bacterium]
MANVGKVVVSLALIFSLYSIYNNLIKPSWLRNVSGSDKGSIFETGNLNLHTAQLETIFIEMAEKASPAVVNVRGERLQGKSLVDYLPDWGKFFMNWLDSKPSNWDKKKWILPRSQGSGFIINRKGYIVTNYHVIEDADRIVITLFDNKKLTATLIGADSETDLALLKVNALEELPVLFLGNSKSVRVGEWVVAIGNPFGLSHSLTVGVISGTGRSMGITTYEDFIQTDASINYGNSGGPLLNIKGEAIGMNTAIIPDSEGIGFAIPANIIRKVIDDIAQKGQVIRGWLGIEIQSLTPELAEAFEVPAEDGVLINQVYRGSPAYEGGLQRGDIIVEYDHRKVSSPRELKSLVANTPIGEVVELVVKRDKNLQVVKVVVGQRL